MHVIAEYLSKGTGAILFLAPTRVLVNQHYEFLKNKYGQWIIYDPEFNKKTFILWILTILLFLLGGAIVYRKLDVQK